MPSRTHCWNQRWHVWYGVYGGLHIAPFGPMKPKQEAMVKQMGKYNFKKIACNHCTGEVAVKKMTELGYPVVKGTTDPPDAITIHDSVACFPCKWETDLTPEIPDAGQLTADAKRDMGLHGDSGKPLIARYIARKLTSQDPPFVPPSIQAILEKAVAVKWKKSCLCKLQAEGAE